MWTSSFDSGILTCTASKKYDAPDMGAYSEFGVHGRQLLGAYEEYKKFITMAMSVQVLGQCLKWELDNRGDVVEMFELILLYCMKNKL